MLRRNRDMGCRKWDMGGVGAGDRVADMALFSRRNKNAPDSQASEATESGSPEQEDATRSDSAQGGAVQEQAQTEHPPGGAEQAEPAPTVGISVQAFRGVGAEAGPEVAPVDAASETTATETAAEQAGKALRGAVPVDADAAQGTPKLPLAPALPPEQTHTVDGLKDNVLLREALAQLEEGATNEQLLGVVRQSLQGHLFLRVHGDARQQVSEGKPLAVGVVRDEDRSFMLAYSSGEALRASVVDAEDAAATLAIAQPVAAVYQQVVRGEFTGLIIDNSSAPHRAVLPTELLQKALEQGDENLTIKSLLAAPREPDTATRVGEAMAHTRMWVAVNNAGEGQPVGIAEARTADGQRLLQLFSHPLEIIALGRGEKPMPLSPEQLASVLASHAEVAGVLIDPAGPTIALDRAALAPVQALATAADSEQ